MLEVLLLSRDQRLVSAVKVACEKLGIALTLCVDAREAATLLRIRKLYGILIDDNDPVLTMEIIDSVRKSPSSKNAVIIIFAERTSAFGAAALLMRKPVSVELALRGLKVALGPMSKELQRYYRHSLRIPVTVTVGSKAEMQATMLNISGSGLALLLEDIDMLPKEESLCIRFLLPGSSEIVQVNGDVMWTDQQGRAGCRWKTSRGDREVLQQWLAAQVIPVRATQ